MQYVQIQLREKRRRRRKIAPDPIAVYEIQTNKRIPIKQAIIQTAQIRFLFYLHKVKNIVHFARY